MVAAEEEVEEEKKAEMIRIMTMIMVYVKQRASKFPLPIGH